MIPLDYQNPRQVARPEPTTWWWPYCWGIVVATIGGFMFWLMLVHIWPLGRWDILEFPDFDMVGYSMIGGFILLTLSAALYRKVASAEQSSNRHFINGVIAGLTLLAVTNFLQRADDADLMPPPMLHPIWIASFVLIPIMLGLMSKRDARRAERAATQNIDRRS